MEHIILAGACGCGSSLVTTTVRSWLSAVFMNSGLRIRHYAIKYMHYIPLFDVPALSFSFEFTVPSGEAWCSSLAMFSIREVMIGQFQPLLYNNG